jgi:hypothetical protein
MGVELCLHNEELNNIFAKYNYDYLVKDSEFGGACSTNGKSNACRLLAGKPKGKRPPLWSSGQSY